MSLKVKIIILFIVFLGSINFSYAETLKFDSATYEGEVKKGKANGSGTVIFSDGSRFEGQFKKNKIKGKGKYTDVNGVVYEGKWKNGKFRKKIDKKTRHIVKLDLKKGVQSFSEMRGKGAVTSKWFEAVKNASGTYELTEKGQKDSDKAEKAAADSAGGGGSSGGGGGGGGGSGC